MTIKVYGAPLSPMVRKVLLSLDLKTIDYEVDPIVPFPAPQEYYSIHPLGKIPSYRDESITLCDSSVICDYIDNRFPGYRLYPNAIEDRAKALWLEEYADTKLLTTLGPGIFFERIVKKIFFKQACDEEKVKHTIEVELPPILNYLEAQLPENGFLYEQLYLADISLASVFLNAKYADYQVDEERWPITANYLERVWAHEVYAKRIAEDTKIFA